MGCDRATIHRKDELVRRKKKLEQRNKNAKLAFKWKYCAIKRVPLRSPMMSCGLGKLYRKDSVIEGLSDRSILPESAAHIKTLKDVQSLKLTPNLAFADMKLRSGYYNYRQKKSPYICPVIGLEMNGQYKFCFLWTCGCVMSERALKQAKTTVCPRCQTPFKASDIVVINAEDDDLSLMIENMQIRKATNKKRANSDDQQVQEEEEKTDAVSKANTDQNKSSTEHISKKIKSEETTT